MKKPHRHYWLMVFRPKTWHEFIRAGANVAGFPERARTTINEIISGDQIVCYVSTAGFIGLLEVISAGYEDWEPIWDDDVYPCRVRVHALVILNLYKAIPVLEFRTKLSLFRKLKDTNYWGVFFMRSISRWKLADAEFVIRALKQKAKTLGE